MAKKIKSILFIILLIAASFVAYQFSLKYFHQNRILKQVISRLEAESRIAEVLVTNVNYDEKKKKVQTTIKFLEYDVDSNPLEPKYFTFSGNIIQFQSLVIRFDDIYIRSADRLRGRSAYLFWKVFMLDGENTQEYEVTKAYRVPEGYKVEGTSDTFEKKLWQNFWQYALNPDVAKRIGIKNAQIEHGDNVCSGHAYTLRIEHDGGIKIDAVSLPAILKGEQIPK